VIFVLPVILLAFKQVSTLKDIQLLTAE